MKLLIVDLDGTLFDTKVVNYLAYKEAVEEYGFSIDYEYYCEYCNGRHYMEFLPQITTTDENILRAIHDKKKKGYKKYIDRAIINQQLVDMINIVKENCKIALVTTASRENTMDILQKYSIESLFDLILTHEQVTHIKPNPEGYIKAMNYFNMSPEETVIFEDSEVGIEAAIKSGATVFVAKGYN